MSKFHIELRSRIGGPRFLDEKALVITIPFLIFASVFSLGFRFDSNHFGQASIAAHWLPLVAANILSIALCWAVIRAINLLKGSSSGDQTWALASVLVISFLLGVFKGATTGLFAYFLGVESELDVAIEVRVFQTGIIGLLLIPGISSVASTIDNYRDRREIVFVSKLKELQETNFKGNSASVQDLERGLARAEAELAALDERVRADDIPAAAMLSETLRRISQGNLRPLSHELWNRVDTSLPKFELMASLKAGILDYKANFLVTSLVMFSICLPQHLAVLDPGMAITRTLLFAVLCGALIQLLSIRKPSSQLFRIVLYFVNPLTATVIALTGTIFLLGDNTGFDPATTVLLTYAIVIQTELVMSFGASLVSEKRRLIQSEALMGLDENAERDAERFIGGLQLREIAERLHSDVQNRLLSAAFAGESGGLSKDDVLREIASLRSLFRSFLNSPGKTNESISEVLDDLRNRWGEFLHIEIDWPPQLDISATHAALSQVLNEAVTNSVRHGHATAVSICLGEDEFGRLQITVRDNGLVDHRKGDGLGFKAMRLASSGAFAFTADESGTVLRLTL